VWGVPSSAKLAEVMAFPPAVSCTACSSIQLMSVVRYTVLKFALDLRAQTAVQSFLVSAPEAGLDGGIDPSIIRLSPDQAV
jgi:hypothetical protein